MTRCGPPAPSVRARPLLHLVKLCVGCNCVHDLQVRIEESLAADGRGPDGAGSGGGEAAPARLRAHVTRRAPTRAGEIVGGGSLYWVMHGQIMCRERVLDIRPFTDGDGIGRCRLMLDCRPVAVEPRPCRPFQGWRYLCADAAPPDLADGAPHAPAMPEELRRELRHLGLL